MKKTIKRISSCFLAVAFIILLGESGYLVHSNPIVFCQEVSDINNTIENSHSHSLEDHFYYTDSKSKQNQIQCYFDFNPVLNALPENDYITSIWQPPQFS